MSEHAPLKLGDPALRTVAVPLPEHLLGGEELADLLSTLHATADRSGALSVSATEVGVPVRVLIVTDPDSAERVELVNPEISFRTVELVRSTEACLCAGNLQGDVDRVALIHVDAVSPKGDRLCFDAEGLFAVGLQHGVDHLDGVLFIDRCDTRTLAFTEEVERLRAESTELEKEE